MSFSTSTTNVHGFIKGSLGIVATVSTTANALPSLTTTTVQNSATWSFQSMVSTQLVSGDKVFIDFTNNRAAFQTSTAAISSGITSMLVFTNVPGIYATVSSQAPAVIMNNPSYPMSAVIKLSSYFGQSLVQVATSASMTFSQGTLTATITTPQAPTVPFTVSVSISLTLIHFVPTGGTITIGFPTSFYSSISCTSCVSSLSNASYKSLVTYTNSTSGSYYLITISNFATISAGTMYLNEIQATCKLGGSSSLQITTYASGGYGIDTQLSSLTVNSAATALPGIVLLPRLSLKTGPRLPTASSVADVDLWFRPYTTITPSASGYLVLTFAFNTDWNSRTLSPPTCA